VSEPAPGRDPAPQPSSQRTSIVRHRPALVGLGLLGVLLVAAVLVAVALAPPSRQRIELVPPDQLEARWGTYLSEREWGTPREAVGDNGWGLSWRGAIDTDYRYSDDGIAGLTDADNEFRIGWAFWDGRQDHVSERFMGVTDPQAETGATIIDDRALAENSTNGSYSRLVYRYPADEPAFEIEIESAKLDSGQLAVSATATNIGPEPAALDVVLKGWLERGGTVEPLAPEGADATGSVDGLLLVGESTSVAVVGGQPAQWQVTDEKGALDANLRRPAGLAGDLSGHIGALAYRLQLAPGASRSVRLTVAEANSDGRDAALRARSLLGEAAFLISARRAEARELFLSDVQRHRPLYQAALMGLLWNRSYYEWDGTSGVNRAWAGLVDARDVLVMPDKWEYPFLSSWDLAFHAVTATLVDGDLAEEQLRFLLSDRWQQPDGHIPCSEWAMDDECPPVFAWAAWRTYAATRNREFLEAVYPGLQRHYDYWWQTYHLGDALFDAGAPGIDNLPRAVGKPQVDATAWMAFFARDMARIASELRDPATAERYWVDRGLIQDAINASLWDEQTGFYYDMNARGQLMRQKSYRGTVALIAGVVPPERLPLVLDALRDERQLMAPGGIRSLSAQSAMYTPGLADPGVNTNWRGPVWLPINYLLVGALAEVDPGLASDLRDRLIAMVERDWQITGRFHEFFDADTGEGLGSDARAGWTALVANLIADAWPATP
jgi:hypothetical protein